MGDIYAGSFCSLAACVGSDSESGLFTQRDPFALHICEVSAGSGSSLGKYSSSGVSRFTVEDRESFELGVASSALMSRAWVHEEIRLWPRVLYFAPQQLSWGCPTICTNAEHPTENLPELSQLSQWQIVPKENIKTRKTAKGKRSANENKDADIQNGVRAVSKDGNTSGDDEDAIDKIGSDASDEVSLEDPN